MVAGSKEKAKVIKPQTGEWKTKRVSQYYAQKGQCAICRKELRITYGKKTHLDHNHLTGKVRGILCRDCNLGIGFLKDNPHTVLKAYYYLLLYS